MSASQLTNAELAVLEVLWERGELTARELREHLYPDAERAQHGTVQRFLQSLEEKGCVVRDRSLHVHGGYGFSEEYDIQLFFRRARALALLLGDPARECRRLADRMFTDPAAA